jgi:hypothetical protein
MFIKKLVPNVESKKFLGLRIATVGFLCVIMGLVLFLLKAQLFGRIILYLGFIVVFIGIFTNLYILIKRKR